MTRELEKKVKQAIKLLQTYGKVGDVIELAYSGGKDSDVILTLAQMAGINFKAYYKCTTIDPPRTISYCKSKGVEIVKPKETFAQVIQKRGLPTRWKRFCCSVLKEYKILDRCIVGIRRSESRKRAEMYKEPSYCRVYNKHEKVEQILPILEWTDDDVTEFVKEYNVQCHPLYYDDEGNFHVERRLGCLCCPLASKRKRIEEFKKYPNMVKFYVRNAQIFLETHPDTKSGQRYKDGYEAFYQNVFCDNIPQFEYEMSTNLWGNVLTARDCLKIFSI